MDGALAAKGVEMHDFIRRLFPICRSLTGDGVRETLRIIKEHIPITMHEVPSGTVVFDWKIPKEWNIKDAYIEDENGQKIVDFKKNNLHVIGYSTPINKTITLAELQEHLHSLPDRPDAIPYVFSFYKEQWGFCMTHHERLKLKGKSYKIVIDSEFKEGFLTYAELIIPGESEKEIFISTYVCHPSMANNELSGPAVATFLAKSVLSKPRRYTYRFIFIPETIGAITYLTRNLEKMKKNVIAGFNLTCVGDNGSYSYIPTRNGDTYTDKVMLNVLSSMHPDFIKYSFLDRGSDERQYNAPGIDLPVCCFSRSKFGKFPQYHTSLDNLDFVTAEGLASSLNVLDACVRLLEENKIYQTLCLGEAQLGKRGLYPTISSEKSTYKKAREIIDFMMYADGRNDLIDISNKINVPVFELYPVIEKLIMADLLKAV
jgi:aminopeptidase-like protein